MECIKLTLYGDSRTKKNSQRIVRMGNGRPLIMPSKQYKDYEAACLRQIPEAQRLNISERVNVQMVYYMHTRRIVDLVGLEESTLDILVRGGVLADDNCKIAAAYDGSCVKYDKDNPRVEIEIAPWYGETL